MIVADASVVMAVALTEPKFEIARDILAASDLLHAPSLLPYEVVSVLNLAVRQRRMSSSESLAAIAQFTQLPWSFELQVGGSRLGVILALAAKHKLTGYDSSYLELAMHTGCPLASFDKDLRAASTAEGVAVLPKKLS